MNIKENPNLESVKAKSNFRTKLIRTGAGTAAAFIALTSVGCDQIYATNPTTSISGEITPGETTKTPTEPTTEVTMPTTRETTNSTTKETTVKPTTEATTTPTPPPTTEETIDPTSSELEGIPAERLQFVKDLLEIYENSLSTDNTAFNTVDDCVTREQIIEYGKTGEYGDIENFSIIKHEDGSPAIALINCKDNVVSSFKTAIKEMEVYDPNYLKEITTNGARAFIINRFDTNGSSTFTFNKPGLIVWNATEKKLSESNLAFALKSSVETESFGIKMYQLGGDYSKYVGFMKELLSSDCWWNLYKKTGDKYCQSLSYNSYIQAKLYYNQFYAPENFQDEKIQNLLKSVRDNNLATPFGGSWSEISASIVDRPDWKGGEIE